jgi:hypothetical protein
MLRVPEPVSLNLTKAIERSNPTTSRAPVAALILNFWLPSPKLIFILY